MAQIIRNQINGVGNIGAALEAQIGVLPQSPQLLGQAVANQLGALGDLAGVGQTFVENLTDVLLGSGPGTVQGQLQQALDFLNQGEFGQAFQFLAVLPLLPILGNGLTNIELIPPLIAALQQPLADAATLFPVAAGPLANAQAALGVLGDPLNALIIGVGALTAVAGVADAAGNTLGGLIDAAQNGDPEGAFNTVVTQAAAGTSALLGGVLDPQFGLIAGLNGLRAAIAAAITTPSFPSPAAITDVTKAPGGAAQTFALTTAQEKAPESKRAHRLTKSRPGLLPTAPPQRRRAGQEQQPRPRTAPRRQPVHARRRLHQGWQASRRYRQLRSGCAGHHQGTHRPRSREEVGKLKHHLEEQ